MNPNIKNAIIMGAVALAIIIVVPSLWGWDRGWNMMGVGWIFMPVLMIAFWVLVVWAVILLVKGLSQSTSHTPDKPGGRESPLDVLKRRYASGEISKEEFEEKKKDLL